MPEATLEQRMTVLEEAVRGLQEAMNARKPAADWLDRVIGSMKDEPAFDEVLALAIKGRDSRNLAAEPCDRFTCVPSLPHYLPLKLIADCSQMTGGLKPSPRYQFGDRNLDDISPVRYARKQLRVREDVFVV